MVYSIDRDGGSLMLCSCSFSRQMISRIFGFSWKVICCHLFLIKSGTMVRKTYSTALLMTNICTLLVCLVLGNSEPKKVLSFQIAIVILGRTAFFLCCETQIVFIFTEIPHSSS